MKTSLFTRPVRFGRAFVFVSPESSLRDQASGHGFEAFSQSKGEVRVFILFGDEDSKKKTNELDEIN